MKQYELVVWLSASQVGVLQALVEHELVETAALKTILKRIRISLNDALTAGEA